jgi:2-polyprenyl-3-methyl-5-hydroxy-6-metoxy-1,4-benzoquinol methylase
LRAHRTAGRGRRCALLVSDVCRYDLVVVDPGPWPRVWFRCGSELRPVIRRPAAEDRRLGLLEEIFDPVSRRRRSGVQAGWRCLEVGAGRGSMAVWLAERVGPSGGVVATDIDVSYLERLDARNLEVRRHNILEDSLDALEPGSFDAVCSRLMLFHLVGRQEQALRQMMLCLKPGGC